MTTIETAEKFAGRVYTYGTTEMQAAIRARDAAIENRAREATAREVLDRVAQMVAASIVADDGGQAVTMPRISQLRREFCPTATPIIATPAVLKGDKSEKLADALDEAAIEKAVRAKAVEVLRDFSAECLKAFGDGSIHPNSVLGRVAARHGITLADLEPTPKYTVGDIDVVDCGLWHYWVRCVDHVWVGAKWMEIANSPLPPQLYGTTKFNAESIAAHLRATNNLPGGANASQ